MRASTNPRPPQRVHGALSQTHRCWPDTRIHAPVSVRRHPSPTQKSRLQAPSSVVGVGAEAANRAPTTRRSDEANARRGAPGRARPAGPGAGAGAGGCDAIRSDGPRVPDRPRRHGAVPARAPQDFGTSLASHDTHTHLPRSPHTPGGPPHSLTLVQAPSGYLTNHGCPRSFRLLQPLQGPQRRALPIYLLPRQRTSRSLRSGRFRSASGERGRSSSSSSLLVATSSES